MVRRPGRRCVAGSSNRIEAVKIEWRIGAGEGVRTLDPLLGKHESDTARWRSPSLVGGHHRVAFIRSPSMSVGTSSRSASGSLGWRTRSQSLIVMPGVTTRKPRVKRLLLGRRTALTVCQAMTMAMTVVLPAPVASLGARRGRGRGWPARWRRRDGRGSLCPRGRAWAPPRSARSASRRPPPGRRRDGSR